MRDIKYIAITALLLLMGCGSERPFEAQKLAQVESQYPHSSDWASRHFQFLVQHQDEANRKACLSCHSGQEKAVFLGANINCGEGCHASSSSDNSQSLTSRLLASGKVSSRVENNCESCHSVERNHRSNHFPLLRGACLSCHQVEAGHVEGKGAAVNLLSPKSSCFGCHSESNFQSRVHKELTETVRCENCHSSHGSNFSHLLRGDTSNYCQSCHSKMATEKPKLHRVILGVGGCLQCHDPNHNVLKGETLFQNRGELCLSCHNREITSSEEKPRKISNMAKKYEAMKSIHPPAATENCSTKCHAAHSADYEPLLNERYSKESYVLYQEDPNPYALCFQCHSKNLLNEKIGETDTKFRTDRLLNGEKERVNWHWFHVVNAAGSSDRRKGRACGICHDPHGSVKAHLMRDSWLMGSATIPMLYESKSSGGTCTGPCHESKSYTRIE